LQLAPLQVASLFACVAICVIRDRLIAFISKSGRRAESSYASGLQLSDIRTLELVNTRHAADIYYVKCGSTYGTLRYYAHVDLSWLSSLGCAVVRVKSNGYPESNLGKKYH